MTRFLLMLAALALLAPTAQAGCWDRVHRLPLRSAAEAAGRYWELPEGLLAAIVERETGGTWDPEALSPKGARGLGQVMPATVAWLRDRERAPTKHALAEIDAMLQDGWANLCWSARILAHALRVCGGGQRRDLVDWPIDVPCALAGYNAGPGVSDYVADIMGKWRR